MDPFFGDPNDPASALEEEEAALPLEPAEREEVLVDLTDLEL
ncbi:MAG TPA: DUF5319 family protein, partial [Mycobacteriales bacterium]|nr:DUF5319 family protein [Mycobacteriales bacterium]